MIDKECVQIIKSNGVITKTISYKKGSSPLFSSNNQRATAIQGISK